MKCEGERAQHCPSNVAGDEDAKVDFNRKVFSLLGSVDG